MVKIKLQKPMTWWEIVDEVKKTRISEYYNIRASELNDNPAIIFNEINYPEKTRAVLYVREENKRFDNKYKGIEYKDYKIPLFPYFLTKLGREIKRVLVKENKKNLIDYLFKI